MYKVDETLTRDLGRMLNDRSICSRHRNTVRRALLVLSQEEDENGETTIFSMPVKDKIAKRRRNEEYLYRMNEDQS